MSYNLSEAQRLDLALEGLDVLDYGHGKSIKQAIKEEYGADISDDVAEALNLFTMEVPVGHPGDSVERLGDSDEMQVGEVLAFQSAYDGDVYMQVSLNQIKSEIVWGIGEDDEIDVDSRNLVVGMPEASWYEKFENLFDWKRLNNIDKRKLHEYDLSEETYNDLLDKMGISKNERDEEIEESLERASPTPPSEEELNISVGKKRKKQTRYVAKKVKELFQNDKPLTITNTGYRSTGYENIERLILIPSNAERNISDYYWLGGSYEGTQVALANCNVGTYNYLSGLEGVYHIDTFAEMSWRTPVETNEGTTTIANDRDRLVFHLVDADAKPYFEFVQDNMPETIDSLFVQNRPGITHFKNQSWSGPDTDDMLYAPVTEEEYFEVLPAIREAEVTVLYGDKKPNGVRTANKAYGRKDQWLFAQARLNNWDPICVEMSSLLSRDVTTKLTDGGYELVETMAHRHDQGKPPVSKS